MSVKTYGQNVGINATGTSPDASAMLDVTATNKGVLVPRVTLSATTVASPVTAPANSLLVYNTATAGTAPNNVTPGFYYWSTDSTKWIKILTHVGIDQSKDVWIDDESTGTVQTASRVSDGVLRGDSAKVVVTDTGRVGIGTVDPQGALHVVAARGIIFDRLGNGDVFSIRKARHGSTYNNLLPVVGGTGLGQVVLTGHYGGGWDNTAGVCLQAFSSEAWSATARGTGFKMYVTPKLSTTRVTAITINSDGKTVIGDNNQPASNETTAFARLNAIVGTTGSTERALHIGSVNSDALYIVAPLAATGATNTLVWDAATGKVGYATGTPSDARLKSKIVNTKFGLSDLMKISVKDYEYKSAAGKTSTGFIAQDLQKIYPEAVYVGTDEKDASGKLAKPWTVDYGKLTPLIVKSIQEQETKIVTLEQKVQDLEKTVEKLLKALEQSK